MLTTPQRSVHLVVQSKFLNIMVGTQLFNIVVETQLQLSASMADYPTIVFLPILLEADAINLSLLFLM